MASLVTLNGAGQPAVRPVLHLDGPRLRAALEQLIAAAEPQGGVERYAEAMKLKAAAYQQMLGDGRAASLDLADFEELAATMPTVRRRIGRVVDEMGWTAVRAAIARLFEVGHDTTIVDERMAAFCSAFPATKEFRFARDLGAEVLHNVLPEHYPLMQRWVWDMKANTGVIREIWHGDNVDAQVIDVADDYETFLVLREELSQFLSDNGVFRDMLWYVDLLSAHIYGGYINAQGGAYLKTDFSAVPDPLEHTRRILGLDAVKRRPDLTRSRTIDGGKATPLDLKRLPRTAK